MGPHHNTATIRFLMSRSLALLGHLEKKACKMNVLLTFLHKTELRNVEKQGAAGGCCSLHLFVYFKSFESK